MSNEELSNEEHVSIPIQSVANLSLYEQTAESRSADISVTIADDRSDKNTGGKMSLVWLSRIIPVFGICFAIGYIIYLILDSENWETDPEASGAVKLRRETNRGLFVSVLIAMLLNFIGAFMFYIKVHEGLVVTNYGFILGPVIGYLLDQGIGTDDGFKVLSSYPLTIRIYQASFNKQNRMHSLRWVYRIRFQAGLMQTLCDILSPSFWICSYRILCKMYSKDRH